ncbi:MAG: 4-alpha-glucanotransferase [Desulfobacteraceae bacterium]
MQPDNLWNELIDELGHWCGIEPEYTDNAGQVHVTSRQTKLTLLKSMGLKLDSLADLQQAVIERRQRPWNRLLEPVLVVLQSTGAITCNLHLTLPDAQLGENLQIDWELSDEGDRVWRGQMRAPELQVTETRLINDQLQGRVPLSMPENLALGYYELRVKVKNHPQEQQGQARLIVTPEQVYVPPYLQAGGQTWGLIFPLYAMRRASGWGVGDFGDLREAVSWAGGELQAGLIGLNPFNALTNRFPDDVSPYAPSTRLYWSMIYLDVEAIPELADCPAAQALRARSSFQAEKERLNQADQVDYAAVFNLKRRFLELLFDTFLDCHGFPAQPRTARGQALARYIAQEGESLQTFAIFQSLSEHWRQQNLNYRSWTEWPPQYHNPGNDAVQTFARQHPREILFYQYVQWLLEEQLQQAADQARALGMPVGLYPDLALGVDAGGHDSWSCQDLFALKMEIGAPPDAFNPLGQNWQLPPLIPERLRETKYQLFIDTLRKNCRPAGALRVDHVMGLFRLFWIPQGKSPAEGAYVRYDSDDLLRILALESVRHQTVIIGEDLGTVPGYIRETLAHYQIFSYRLFYFERTPAGQFRLQKNYPALALASVTTHDLPTLAGFWSGRDIEVKERLQLYPRPEMADLERQERQTDKRRVLEILKAYDLLPEEYPEDPEAFPELTEELRWGILAFLAQTPCRLLALNLEDVFGGQEQQNFPGTIHQYPNWRLKMPWSLSQMQQSPQAHRLADLMAGCRPRTAPISD